MSVKVCIFDADGMVININQMFSQRLISAHPPLKNAIQTFFQNQFQRCVIGRADLKDELKSVLPQWNINQTPDKLLSLWFESENQPNQALIALIPQIQKQSISCYLATNQEKYRLAYLADDMGFIHLFDHMFVSCEIGAKKPELKYLTYVWNSLQYLDNLNAKNEVLFWDDRPEYVSAASAFGFDARQFISNAEFIERLHKSGISI